MSNYNNPYNYSEFCENEKYITDVLSDAGVHIFIIMAVVQWHYRFCKDYTKGESK